MANVATEKCSAEDLGGQGWRELVAGAGRCFLRIHKNETTWASGKFADQVRQLSHYRSTTYGFCDRNYLGPDYSAEYLHRLSEVTRDTRSEERRVGKEC